MKLITAKHWPCKNEYGAEERQILGTSSSAAPLDMLKHCPAYSATPLRKLPKLGQQLGLAQVLVKDESHRLRLGSFKALGGVYAIARILQERAASQLGRSVDASELLDDAIRELAADLTFACATDGNHGRSVAAGARLFGARSVVFLPRNVAEHKVSGIARFGAEIVQTDLDYDDAVAESAEQAAANGWTLVSDTSEQRDDPIPRDIMHGYTVMVAEILQQVSDSEAITHVFLQGGVGGLAAAVTGALADKLGADRPTVIIVEPESANCLQASAAAGRPVKIDDLQSTRMAMLECGEPSASAWPILDRHADFFLDLPDNAIDAATEAVANADPALRFGDSGLAGLAGMLTVVNNPDWRTKIGLDESSNVLCFATEGDS